MTNLKTGKEFSASEFQQALAERAAILKADPARQQEYVELTEKIKRGIADVNDLDLAGSANASVGRGMMRNVGARNAAMFGGKKFTVNDYIRPSSVFLFDGIENLGFGQHGDASPWVSLVGSHTAVVKQHGSSWTANGLSGDTSGASGWGDGSFGYIPSIVNKFSGTDCTIEIVFSCDITNSNSIWSVDTSDTRFRKRVYAVSSSGLCGIRSYSESNTSYGFQNPSECVTMKIGNSADSALIFGGTLYGPGGSYLENIGMKGTIHAIRGYAEYLSDDVINAHYEADKARFNLP